MMNGVKPYSRAQLADDLAMLSSKVVNCGADLESWSLLARAVSERLLVSDYLTDAQLRLSDPDYAAAQGRIVRRLIARLRQEDEPARVAVG